MKQITVLLAEENRMVRREFRKILEGEADLEVVGESKNGKEAVAKVKKLHPEVVLLGVTVSVLNGFEATRQILKAAPGTKVLILSAYSDEAYVEAAVKSGVVGYLIKHLCADELCQAIRGVQMGKTFFSPSILRRLYEPPKRLKVTP